MFYNSYIFPTSVFLLEKFNTFVSLASGPLFHPFVDKKRLLEFRCDMLFSHKVQSL